MQLKIYNGFNKIKQGDTKSEFKFQLLGYDDAPIDLTSKTVSVIVANSIGKILEKAPIIVDASTAIISFNFANEDITGYGDMQLEVHITDVAGLKQIVPSDGYYKFAINRNLNDASSGVTNYTLQYFTSKFNGWKTEIDSANDNANTALETANNVKDEFNQVVAEAGTNNPEVVQARGNEVNLNARFNKFDEHLADNATQKLFYVKTEAEFLSIVQSIKDSIKVSMTNKVKVVLQAGTYTFANTVVIPPYMRIGVNGVVVINYTGSSTLFHVKYEDTLAQVNTYTSGFTQNPLHNGNIFDGSDGALILKGTGKAGTQIAVRFGDETLVTKTDRKHLAWTHYSNFYVESFGTAFSFTQKENYIMTFNNVTVSTCGKIIKDEGSFVNSGEEIRWNNCSFHNSDLFLELNSEINHIFTNCSIDYNAAGVTIQNDKYATIRFVNCWIEASNTTKVNPFIKSNNTNVKAVNVIMNSNYMYPRDKIADQLFKGKFKLLFKDNFLFMNRYSAETQNIGEGAILCDDEVIVLSTSGTTFQEQPAVISRYQALNTNSNFETDAVGTTTITGFVKGGVAGEANIVVDNVQFFSGSKSLKIDTVGGTKTYANVLTEKIPIRNAERVLGQARLFLPTAKAYGITTVINFYAEDKTTVIDTLSLAQNITTTTANKWVSLLTGAFYDKPIPPKATHAEFKITIGSLTSDIWVDDMVLAYY